MNYQVSCTLLTSGAFFLFLMVMNVILTLFGGDFWSLLFNSISCTILFAGAYLIGWSNGKEFGHLDDIPPDRIDP